MAKATKKEDRRRVDVCIPYRSLSLKEFDDYTLDEAIERLQRVKSENPGKTIVLKVQGVLYDDYEEYGLYERRPETDEEMLARQEKERQNEADREARDRAQYEALSLRFGSKTPSK